MSTVNYPNPKTDTTVRLYDEFYNYSVDVPVQEYEVVYAFFNSKFGTREAAGNFTLVLFRMSEESGVPVMALLQEMQGQDAVQLTLTLAYYLNGTRSKSTLLGINTTITPNYYVARNVRS